MKKLFFCLLWLTTPCFAKAIKVAFVVPDQGGTYFWNLVEDVNASVAKNLDIELTTVHSHFDRFSYLMAIKKVALSEDKPDYIIFRGFNGYLAQLFDLLEKQNIKFITLEQALSDKTKKQVGQPRQRYKNWLGQILYDNEQGGKQLLHALLLAHQQKSHGKAYVSGIGGDNSTLAQARQHAFETFNPNDYPFNTTINQVFTTNWQPSSTIEKYRVIQRRFPSTNIIWCAGDQMALTVLSQLEKNPPHKVIIGGFDWVPQALEKIQSGQMTASVGGHFLMVAQALIYIADLQHGNNRFLTEGELHQYEVITQENVAQYIDFISQSRWQNIDFKPYLKANQPNAEKLNVANMMARLPADQIIGR